MGINILIEFLIFGVELLKIILLMHFLINCKFKNRVNTKLFIIIACSFLVLTIGVVLKFSDLTIELIIMILMMITVLAVFCEKFYKIIFMYLIAFFIISIIDGFNNYIIISLTPITDAQLYSNRLNILLVYLISLMLILIIIAIQKCLKGFTIHLLNLHWSNYVLLVWTIISFSSLLSYLRYIEKESNNLMSVFLVLSFPGVTIGMVVIVILLSRAAYMRDKYKVISILNQNYLEAQKQYYVLLSEKDEDTRRFRHDIRNHLLCLSAFVQENKIDEISEYIKALSIDLQEISRGINSGSNVVDAIISDSLQKNPNHIIIVNGILPNPLNISAVDLCTIFSNVISNAVEALSKLEDSIKKEVIINIKNHENFIYINSSNKINSKILFENNLVKTTKSDKEWHGYGLGNIRKCVDKYNGTVDISSTDTEFYIDILLKNIFYDRLTS